jgi:hypothetical protein
LPTLARPVVFSGERDEGDIACFKRRRDEIEHTRELRKHYDAPPFFGSLATSVALKDEADVERPSEALSVDPVLKAQHGNGRSKRNASRLWR